MIEKPETGSTNLSFCVDGEKINYSDSLLWWVTMCDGVCWECEKGYDVGTHI